MKIAGPQTEDYPKSFHSKAGRACHSIVEVTPLWSITPTEAIKVWHHF
jgi:hypothetical protein